MENEQDLCKCGKPSTIGAHGIRDNEVYDEYMCSKCYSGKDNEGDSDV